MPLQPRWELLFPKAHLQPTPTLSLSRSPVPPGVLLTAPACPQTSCRQCARALHCTACSRFWHQNLGPCAQSRDEADPAATVGVRATSIRIQFTLVTLPSPPLQPSFMAKGWPLLRPGSSESSCFCLHHLCFWMSFHGLSAWGREAGGLTCTWAAEGGQQQQPLQ